MRDLLLLGESLVTLWVKSELQKIFNGIFLIVYAIGAWVGLSRIEWAVIAFTIALVLILEGLNTSIEATVDLAMPRVHPLARHAKDLAAGMVLLAAIASVAVGSLILLPPLWKKLFG